MIAQNFFKDILDLAKDENKWNFQACYRKKTKYGLSAAILINKDYSGLNLTVFIHEISSCINYAWSIADGCLFEEIPPNITIEQSDILIEKSLKKGIETITSGGGGSNPNKAGFYLKRLSRGKSLGKKGRNSFEKAIELGIISNAFFKVCEKSQITSYFTGENQFHVEITPFKKFLT